LTLFRCHNVSRAGAGFENTGTVFIPPSIVPRSRRRLRININHGPDAPGTASTASPRAIVDLPTPPFDPTSEIVNMSRPELVNMFKIEPAPVKKS
jgi:hypothetical protein